MNEFMEQGFDEFVNKDTKTMRVSDEVRYGLTQLGEQYLDQLQKEIDPVNHPKHYTFGKFEVLDVIEDWELGFHLGNVVKYVARAKYKGNEIEDLKKAQFYLERYLGLVKGREDEKYCEEIDS